MDGGWSLLRCEAVAWVERDWPGWLKVRLVDTDGHEWFFVDKVPIFMAELGPHDNDFPVLVHLRCDVVGAADDGRVLIVSTARDHVEAEDGTTQFRVCPSEVQQHAV
jgi:hypothetical protein